MNLKCAEVEVKTICYRVTSNPKTVSYLLICTKLKLHRYKKNNTDRDSRPEQFDLLYDEIYIK